MVTILCCWPFGIPAIVYAARAESALGAGNWYAAKLASDAARTWCWVSFLTGLAGGVIYLIVMLAMVGL